MSVDIHPSAVVHESAQLGVDVTIGPNCVVESDTVIGDGTVLDAFCQIKRFTIMGGGNRVFSYACVGGEPQDLKFNGEETKLIIGDRNIIREFVTIHRGTEGGGGVTKIGSGCLLMCYVHVAHDCILKDRIILSTGVMLAGHVEMDDHAAVGGMSGVHQFCRIGAMGFLGAKSGLAQDIPPYTLASGARATLRGLNLIGLRRGGASPEVLSALKKAYKLVFRSGLERKQALNEVEAEFSDVAEVMVFKSFIEASERGVVSDAGRSNGLEESPDEEG